MSIQNKLVSLQNNDSWRPTTGALRPNPDLPPQLRKKKIKSTFPTACQLHTFDLRCKRTDTEKTHTLAHSWLIKTHTHLLELLRWIRLGGEGLLHTSAGIAEHFLFPPPLPFSLALVIMETAWKCDPENKASSWGKSHGNISPSVWTSLRSDATHSGHQGVDAVPPSPPCSARASQTPDASARQKQREKDFLKKQTNYKVTQGVEENWSVQPRQVVGISRVVFFFLNT